MTAPQGIFSFNQITGELGASVTFSLGIAPSITSVTVPPTPGLTRLGTATWSYGGSAIRSLPNSAVQSIRVSRAGGATTWIVAIADRRWVWAESGEISGEYNLESDGEIIAETEKTPRQLAVLCLEAMGETGYDVSAVPVDDRPYVNWQVANPSQALAQLIEPYGLAVTLRINNSVAIVQIGTGGNLPSGYLSLEESIEPAVTPQQLRAVTAPNQYAMDFRCEAVGMDLDGSIKPLNELSYEPTITWTKQSDLLEFRKVGTETSEKARQLAKESVFRWYRITLEQPDFEAPTTTAEPTTTTTTSTTESGDEPPSLLDLPAGTPSVRHLWQILPLIDEEGFPIGSGETQASKRAAIWGRAQSGHSLQASNTKDDVTIDNFQEKYRLDLDFTLDTELGIVKFSQPTTYYVTSDKPSPGLYPATIFLRCTVTVKNQTSRAPTRAFKFLEVDPTSPAGIKYTVREDVIPRFRKNDVGVWTDNLTYVESQLDFYLSQEIANFQAFPGQTADYAGFIALNNDGAIRQVSYTINTDGTAVSKATRNIERYDMSLSFSESKKRVSLAIARQESERNRKKRPIRIEAKPPGGNG
jgi:hypothetical protein